MNNDLIFTEIIFEVLPAYLIVFSASFSNLSPYPKIKYAEQLAQRNIRGATVLYLKNIQHDLDFLDIRGLKKFHHINTNREVAANGIFHSFIKQFFVKDGD